MDASRVISLKYNETISCANELEALAAELKQLASKISENKAALDNSWRGETAQLYRQKLQREILLAEEKARELSNAAGALKAAAERTYRAEMYALSLIGG